MLFVSKLHPAKLICRYKRFLADVKKSDQHIFTVSVPNTGSMLGLTTSDSNVWLSYSDTPKRKYPYRLEIVEADNTLVGINATLANKLALEAIQNGLLPEFSDYKTILSEQCYGQSRIDFLLRNNDLSECYLEVKNVHFIRQKGLAEFPDTITKRGARHLEELIKIVQQGKRAAMLYVIQREDCSAFTVCHDLDPIYGCKFDLALKSGVEFYAIKCHVSVEGIFPIHQVKIENRKKMVSYVEYNKAPLRFNGQIRIFDDYAFSQMRKIGRIAAECLDALTDIIKPGITTREIDNFVFVFGAERGVLPADLNYHGYEHACCTSINHVVCHGIPNEKPLQEGDIVNVDVTFILNGWHGDSSRMYPVGQIKRAAERLIQVTHESLMRGIAVVKPGATTGDIGAAIQHYAESERCSVVRDFCGHGIGQLFHDAPNILHYGKPGEGVELKQGMIFTIEPMINLGKPEIKVLSDGWTAVTRDRSLTAQYEHTIGVTSEGCEIFTESPKNIFYTLNSNN